MSDRAARTEDELRDGAFHVAYEVSMLHIATLRAVEAVKPATTTEGYVPTLSTSAAYVTSIVLATAGDELLRNLFVEGALLHTRNVSEFLFPRGAVGKPDDIVAADYEPSWDGNPGKIVVDGEPLDVLRKRIDKHLSHLTYERVLDPDPKWAVAISRDLLAHFEAFYKMLPAEQREWFGPGVDHFFSR